MRHLQVIAKERIDFESSIFLQDVIEHGCKQAWGQLQITNYNYAFNYNHYNSFKYNYNYMAILSSQLQL